MAYPNPAIDPPVLQPKRNSNIRSPSGSPTRRYVSARRLDPLLRDLSPTTALRAFKSRPGDNLSNDISANIANASDSVKAHGARAARACKNIRSWTREVESWEWPGTFDVPERARKRQRTSGMSSGSFISRPSISQDEDGTEYWGSLPAMTVHVHQRRIDEINEDLDGIDIEEFKDFVLAAHSHAGNGEASIDDGIGAIGADTKLKHLDDVTALVTATILQLLPYLSRLNRMMNTWSIRLSILRDAPVFLRDLGHARTDLDHGWAALAVSNHPATEDALRKANATFSRETMDEMKRVIAKQVHSLGRRLDAFLDMLEGREECVPDSWIEEFETLEEQYGHWVVQAERKVLEGEWKQQQDEVRSRQVDLGSDQVEQGAPLASPNAQRDFASGPDQTVTVGPTVTTTTTSRSRPWSTTTTISTATTPSDPQSSTSRPVSMTITHNRDGSTTISGSPLGPPTTSSAGTTPSTQRPRHVPIVVDSYFANGPPTSTSAPGQSPEASRRVVSAPIRPSLKSASSQNTSNNTVKKRAAFLNSDIEKSDRLNKTKPAPIVRPFEHASNAFTKLFKREKESEAAASTKSGNAVSRGREIQRGGSTAAVPTTSHGRSKMGYADLFSAPIASTPEGANAARSTSYTQESQSRAPKDVDPLVLEYVDRVQPSDVARSDRTRSISQPRPMRDSTLMPEAYKTRPRSSSTRSKRSSKQNITALPSMGLPERYEPLPVFQKQEPETYLPTGLSEPFHSPTESEFDQNMPENWPLTDDSTPVREPDDPISHHIVDVPQDLGYQNAEAALSAEDFEHMFVASMESTPQRALTYGAASRQGGETKLGELNAFATSPRIETVGDDAYYLERPAPDRSLLRTGSADRSIRLSDGDNDENVQLRPRPVSRVMEDEENLSDQDLPVDKGKGRAADNAAAYFGGSSERDLDASAVSPKRRTPAAMLRNGSFPPVSPMLPRLRIPPDSPEDDGVGDDVEQAGRTAMIRQASATSIETFPKSRVRSIEILRRSSIESPASVPQTPSSPVAEQSSRAVEEPGSSTHALHYKGQVYFPSPPVSPPTVPPRGSSLRSSFDRRRSMDTKRSENHSPRIDPEELIDRLTQPKRRKEQPTDSPRNDAPLRKGEDVFDRHVSEVLDRVHATNIKFRTRAGAVTPLAQQRPGAKLPKAGERAVKNKMTLAPAETSPRKATPADPEVKLYHLTEAGRSEPIKLYVRLVGEGERVMVRVGGGWADLAEYLRQYAEHHGSRTVSEGGLHLQTADAAVGSSPATGFAGKRTFSTPAAAEPRMRGRPTTPISGLPGSSRPVTGHSERGWLPQDTAGDEESVGRSPLEANVPILKTPTSSRPQTTDGTTSPEALTAALVASSRHADSSDTSPAGNLSMSGSNRMKADLPEQKARWVEGMIERVNKSASAEKNKAWADIGKVGSTRRMVFRQSSGAAGPSV